MKVVLPARRHKLNLRCAGSLIGTSVLRRKSKLGDVVGVWTLNGEIRSIGVNKVVLNVNAVAGDVGKRTSLTING